MIIHYRRNNNTIKEETGNNTKKNKKYRGNTCAKLTPLIADIMWLLWYMNLLLDFLGLSFNSCTSLI